MLTELHIRDFALIDQIDIEFAPGLNVLTGETGAGKSIVVDALQLAVGARASADVVRRGRERAGIVAVFQADPAGPAGTLLREMDLHDASDPERVILRRDVLASGRSQARVNGQPVTVTQLQSLGERLVDVHGQHDHQSLLRPRTQLDLLDAYGGSDLLARRRRFSDRWTRLVHARARLAELRRDERDRARRLDLIRFQIEEIDGAALEPGEEERLRREQRRLDHLGRLQQEAARLYGALVEGDAGGPGAVSVLQDAAHTLAALADIDGALRETAAMVESASLQAQEAASFLRTYGEGLEADPRALEAAATRLALISGLRRKYGSDIEEVLAFAEGLRKELKELEDSDSLEADLVALVGELEAACAADASALSAARRKAADGLEEAVSAELEGLHMGPGRFRVALTRRPDDDGLVVDGEATHTTGSGVDEIQFMLSSNPGEPPRPLARVASGGELSRVALALKRSLVAVDAVPTLVFDEIDAGIGGATAQAVARRLDDIGRRRQVICVTHLAQIATAADRHIHIHKAPVGGRTVVAATALDEARRVEEIARMLAGVLTDSALHNARELLALARDAKR